MSPGRDARGRILKGCRPTGRASKHSGYQVGAPPPARAVGLSLASKDAARSEAIRRWWWKVLAFSENVQTELMRLVDDNSISVQGTFKVGQRKAAAGLAEVG